MADKHFLINIFVYFLNDIYNQLCLAAKEVPDWLKVPKNNLDNILKDV